MATKKTRVTVKQKKTWKELQQTRTDVLRPHEKEIVLQYHKELIKEIKPITHKDWLKAIENLNQIIK